MDSDDFHIKMKNGARRFCIHRIHVPLPLFLLKIVLIIALIVISVIALVHTFILDKILAWKPPPIILGEENNKFNEFTINFDSTRFDE